MPRKKKYILKKKKKYLHICVRRIVRAKNICDKIPFSFPIFFFFFFFISQLNVTNREKCYAQIVEVINSRSSKKKKKGGNRMPLFR